MDAYALGATLWSLVFRLNPDDWDLMDAVNNATTLPDFYRSILEMLLEEDPRRRQSVHNVLLFMRTDGKLRGIIDSL